MQIEFEVSDSSDSEEIVIKKTNKVSKSKSKKSDSDYYKSLSHIEQILLRPETYIGSHNKLKYSDVWTCVEENNKDFFIKSDITYSKGLLNLFVEALSNSIDNIWRSIDENKKDKSTQLCKNIKINVNSDNIVVYNEGKHIPVVIHQTEKIYIPQMIYGKLHSGSNYDDTEERKTSGRNGVGIKLCNIFSKKFCVEINDPLEKKLYTQVWEKNMGICNEPSIKKSINKIGYVKVTFYPEFYRFDCENFDKDILGVIKKHVYDSSMIANKDNTKVFYNDVLLNIQSLKDYALLYYNDEQKDYIKESKEMLQVVTDDYDIVLAPSFKEEFNHVSFVNGIYTSEGGVHVDNWSEALFRPIIDKINNTTKKQKNTFTINIRHVNIHFSLFINSSLDKPRFTDQTKKKLSFPNDKQETDEKIIKKIFKWSVMDKIKNIVKAKEFTELKTIERKRGQVKVENLEDANYARSNSLKKKNCILCVCEGLSAKTYLVSGLDNGILGRKGRDEIGILPISGKLLNTTKSTVSQLKNNKVIVSLIQSIGLQQNVDYSLIENRNKLRYPTFMACTDSDYDGIHIISLLYLFFYNLFPSILTHVDFFNFMRVPIIKISLKNEEISFYFLKQAREYIQTNAISKNNIKYYKGLGTYKKSDIKIDYGKYISTIVKDNNTEQIIKKLFDIDTKDRKEWLKCYNEREDYPIISAVMTETLTVSEFLDKEFIEYCVDACVRALPKIDGFKQSIRKIIYTVLEDGIYYNKKSIKVAQLGGRIAQITNYAHGEQNLMDTIIGLAQRFVGSNNLPLLYNDGAFGSRLEMGNDAASSRYIYTKGEVFLRKIFREEDDYYINNLEEDGDTIEKELYYPIICMLLANGISGIGVGSSCNIPTYNPIDIINWQKEWINCNGEYKSEINDNLDSITVYKTPDLIPWYRGFKGEIKVEEKTVYTYGLINKIKSGVYNIIELPIGKNNMSISKYRQYLDDLIEKKYIKGYDDKCNDDNVNFFVFESNDSEFEINHKNMKLIDSISLNNMTVYKDNEITKYNNVEEILNDFCIKRLDKYKERRTKLLEKYREILTYIKNKIRFIEEVEIKFSIKRKKLEDVDIQLESLGFDRDTRITNKRKNKKDDDDKDDNNKDDKDEYNKDDKDDEYKPNIKGNYKYLLSMSFLSSTDKKIKELQKEQKDYEDKIYYLETHTASDIWNDEMNEFLEVYKEWLKNPDGNNTKQKKRVVK